MHIINLEKFQTLDELKKTVQASLEKEKFCLIVSDGEMICSIFSPEVTEDFIKQKMSSAIKRNPNTISELLNILENEKIVDENI